MDCGEIWQFRQLQVENKVNYLTIWPQLLGHSHQFLSLDEQFIQACTNSNHWMTDHIFLKLEIHAYSSNQISGLQFAATLIEDKQWIIACVHAKRQDLQIVFYALLPSLPVSRNMPEEQQKSSSLIKPKV